jgi:hypothetical protein
MSAMSIKLYAMNTGGFARGVGSGVLRPLIIKCREGTWSKVDGNSREIVERSAEAGVSREAGWGMVERRPV